jgi:hypothetical protein
MLKLSDCELVNLRLGCWKHVTDHFRLEQRKADGREIAAISDGLVDWCLRDRDEPRAGE